MPFTKLLITFSFLFSTLVTMGQNKDFEAYKKARNAAFKNYVNQQDKLFNAYINDKKAWNRILLGIDVDVAAEEKKEAPTPAYVDLQSNLSEEIKTIKQTQVEKTKKSSVKKENPIEVKPNLASQMLSIPDMHPVGKQYRISSGFGYRVHPIYKRKSFHSGIDLACPSGTPVFATAQGKITYAGVNGNYGKYIVIEHNNGFKTAYAHLSLVDVKVGRMVKKGEVIGKSGSTGNSTGPHLHYEVVKKKKKVNPLLYIS